MRDIILKDDERIDDLQCKGLKIIQSAKGFCFGMDAVLLANFCKIKPSSTIVDLGTGTGVIPLLLCAKNDVEKIYGVEIQEDVANMAERSVKLNDVEDKIQIINIDLKKSVDILGIHKFDVVTSNPPYMPKGKGIVNPGDNKAISRHEIYATLEDVIQVSSKLLNHNGKFFMVHRPHRIVDIIWLLRKYNLEPKEIRFVHPKVGQKPNLILIKSIKAAKPELLFHDPLYVYNEDGTYTDEIYKIYRDTGDGSFCPTYLNKKTGVE